MSINSRYLNLLEKVNDITLECSGSSEDELMERKFDDIKHHDDSVDNTEDSESSDIDNEEKYIRRGHKRTRLISSSENESDLHDRYIDC